MIVSLPLGTTISGKVASVLVAVAVTAVAVTIAVAIAVAITASLGVAVAVTITAVAIAIAVAVAVAVSSTAESTGSTTVKTSSTSDVTTSSTSGLDGTSVEVGTASITVVLVSPLLGSVGGVGTLLLLPGLVVESPSLGSSTILSISSLVVPSVGLLIPVRVGSIAGSSVGTTSRRILGVGIVTLVPDVLVGSLTPVLLDSSVESENIIGLVAVVLETLPVVTTLVVLVEPLLVYLLVAVAVADALSLGFLLPEILVESLSGLVLVPCVGGGGAGGISLVGRLSLGVSPVRETLIVSSSLLGAVKALDTVLEPLVAGERSLGAVISGSGIPLAESSLVSVVPGLGGVTSSSALHVTVVTVTVESTTITTITSSAIAVDIAVRTTSSLLASSTSLTLVETISVGSILVEIVGSLTSIGPETVGTLGLVELLGPVLVAAVGGSSVGGGAGELVPVLSGGVGVSGPGRFAVSSLGISSRSPGGILVDVAVVGGSAISPVIKGVGVSRLGVFETTNVGISKIEALVISVVDIIVVAGTL